SGLGKGDLRQENRATTRRAHDWRGSDRAHPRLRRGDESRNDGRGTDAHRLPASDLVRDDEGSRARCVWPRAEYVRMIWVSWRGSSLGWSPVGSHTSFWADAAGSSAISPSA